MKKFYILTKNDQQMETEEEPILFNMDHIVSIKPIKMIVNEQLLDGFWIRTSNGKKYRATKIPPELSSMLEDMEKKRPIANKPSVKKEELTQLQ